MEVYSIWPFFACMGLLLTFASTPLFRAADIPPSPGPDRISSLDGLRGFLALGVFFHHAIIYYVFLTHGRWELPPSGFYILAGQGSVSLFFMITGYLFWSRLIKTGGRPGWLKLYTGRIFRIGPLYLTALMAVLGFVFFRTGLHLHVTPEVLARQIMMWLPLGFREGPDINTYAGTALLLAKVTWTLKFEWWFYISLFGFSLFARRQWLHLGFSVTGLTALLFYTSIGIHPIDYFRYSQCAALFFAGMVSASLEKCGLLANRSKEITSCLALILLVAVFIFFFYAANAGAASLLAIVFFLIVCGADFFGLLSSRPAKRLGDISYGIYLLQGLVLTLVFSSETIRQFALASAPAYWCAVLLCAVLLIAVALVTHVAIERTGIDVGKRLNAFIHREYCPYKP